MDRIENLRREFTGRFGSAPAGVFRAPGRVNLIGEHTDYNDGFVMPAAIGFSCWVAAAPREDRRIVVESGAFSETDEAALDGALNAAGKWSDYVFGVAWALESAGYRLRGANLLIDSDVPLGAGLSSSAAIEVSAASALTALAGLDLDRTRLAQLCLRAECEFVGARVGIMDQFTAAHGRAGHALALDCRTLDFRLVPLPPGIELVICNTMVKHALASGEYNVRRAECEEGVRDLSRPLPHIFALRDVTLAQLERHRDLLSPVVYHRCRHVISENQRVLAATDSLARRDLAQFGRLMGESHRSLRDDYEVSCGELDLMVEIASKQEGVIGSRMTGGGFGGCTINLVRAENASAFRAHVESGYEAAAGLRPEIYVCEASAGAERVFPAADAQFSQSTP